MNSALWQGEKFSDRVRLFLRVTGRVGVRRGLCLSSRKRLRGSSWGCALASRTEQRARLPLLPVEAFLTAAACAHPGSTNVHWPLAKHWWQKQYLRREEGGEGRAVIVPRK